MRLDKDHPKIALLKAVTFEQFSCQARIVQTSP
jgi:hypothetical protein